MRTEGKRSASTTTDRPETTAEGGREQRDQFEANNEAAEITNR